MLGSADAGPTTATAVVFAFAVQHHNLLLLSARHGLGGAAADHLVRGYSVHHRVFPDRPVGCQLRAEQLGLGDPGWAGAHTGAAGTRRLKAPPAAGTPAGRASLHRPGRACDARAPPAAVREANTAQRTPSPPLRCSPTKCTCLGILQPPLRRPVARRIAQRRATESVNVIPWICCTIRLVLRAGEGRQRLGSPCSPP